MFQSHHTLDQLESLYKNARRPTEISRWHVIWLKAKGRTTADIADVVGYHPNTVRRILSSYTRKGAEGLLDKRRFNASQAALDTEQQQQLAAALGKARDDNTAWTSEKVRQYIKDHFAVDITTPCAWRYFEKLGAKRKRSAK